MISVQTISMNRRRHIHKRTFHSLVLRHLDARDTFLYTGLARMVAPHFLIPIGTQSSLFSRLESPRSDPFSFFSRSFSRLRCPFVGLGLRLNSTGSALSGGRL